MVANKMVANNLQPLASRKNQLIILEAKNEN